MNDFPQSDAADGESGGNAMPADGGDATSGAAAPGAAGATGAAGAAGAAMSDAAPASTATDGEAATGWRGGLADLAAALALLTVLPVPGRWQRGAQWPRALRMLPLVGAGTGLAQGLLLIVLLWLLPPLPLAAVLLTLLAGIVLTGALHEDGLADFADALGGRTREGRLRIMRDARIGTFGVLALLLVLSLQAVALLTLANKGAAVLLAALTLAHAGAKLAVVWLLHTLPPARTDGMSASTGQPDDAAMALAGLTVVLPAAGLWPWTVSAWPAAFIAAMLAAAGMRLLCRRLLGGQTGDAAGAMEVVVRTTLLLALAAAAGGG